MGTASTDGEKSSSSTRNHKETWEEHENIAKNGRIEIEGHITKGEKKEGGDLRN